MSTENNSAASPDAYSSELLLVQLRTLKKSSILDRGEAAMRLAETTVVILRDLERRITALENKQ